MHRFLTLHAAETLKFSSFVYLQAGQVVSVAVSTGTSAFTLATVRGNVLHACGGDDAMQPDSGWTLAKMADNDRRFHYGFFVSKQSALSPGANSWTRIGAWRTYHATPTIPALYDVCCVLPRAHVSLQHVCG